MAAALPPAILLMGPTASGKTAVAMHLAERLPVDLISVDSAQVFKGMDIGTAKPDAATRQRFPHYLLDIISPEAHYSAARFRSEALAAMAEITARQRIPLLVGGTMLYFKALRDGLADLPQADAGLRQQIAQEAAARGWPALHAELAACDAETAARLAPHDAQRLQRALEIIRLTGRPMSELLANSASAPAAAYDFLALSLLPSQRSLLHERIASRFEAMLEAGLIEEVIALRQQYELHADLPAMRCVGYRQVWAWLEGEFARSELSNRGSAATRQLAKRQLTWLNNSLQNEGFDCFDPHLAQNVERRVRDFLKLP